MYFDKKWIKVLALALSLPSTILGAAFIIHELVTKNLLDKKVGLFIFLAILGNIFYLMIYHAYKNKD